jgi:hypothetical protein
MLAMAGFKTHITVSSALGAAYGATAAVMYDVPWPACVLAGGLCGVSGMLPDLDSGPGRPLRESLSFAAAVVPLLMLRRLRHLGLEPETMVLIGACVYLLIRFGVGRLMTSITVHRGMFHSVPALAIVGELTYLICDHESEAMRLFNVGAVMIGFGSHLVLDEIWSIDFRRLRLKSSWGTAIKFWGDCWWSNLATYANTIILAMMIMQDPAPDRNVMPSKKREMIASPRQVEQPQRVATQPDDDGRIRVPRSR